MNSPDISSLLSGVLSNPEMLSKIMGVASSLSSSGIFNDIMTESSPTEAKPEETLSHSSTPPPPSQPDHDKDNFNNTAEKRRALLYALKPYLGEKRRDKIDFILKVLALLDAAEGFNKPKN